MERERLAGEDDDEDHPWAVVGDAPAFVFEMLVDEYDGWLDEADTAGAGSPRRWTCRPRRSGSSVPEPGPDPSDVVTTLEP